MSARTIGEGIHTLGRSVLSAVTILYIGIIVLVPLGWLLRAAFLPGVRVFTASLTTEYALAAFANTLIVVAASLAITVPLGTLTALLLTRDNMPGRRILDGLVDLPIAAPAAIAAFALIVTYGPRGLLGPMLGAAGIRIIFAMPGMILATIFVTLPFVVREVQPLMEELGREQVEAARTLGASRLQTFLLVTLPSIKDGILYGASLSYARALGEFGAILVVSGNILGKTQTLPIFIYEAYIDFEMDAAYAAAALLAALSLGGMAILKIGRRSWRS